MGVLNNALEAYTQKRDSKNLDLTTLNSSKILVFDLETKPAIVTMPVYQLKQYSNYIPHKYVTEPGSIISFGAQWFHEPHTVMYKDLHSPDMLDTLWSLLDEADYLVTWNGDRFDIPKAKGHFLLAGMQPPRPSKSIDLMKTARGLGFESSSLDYTARMLNTPHQKLTEIGAGGWEEVINGDPEARKLMRLYCTHDVRVTTDLLIALLPYIKNFPAVNFNTEEPSCPRCGSQDFTDAGTVQTTTIRYNNHRCSSCSGLFRTTIHSRASKATPT